jgi:hypothetical protein
MNQGEGLPESTKVARLHCLRKTFQRGYPISHIDDFREEEEKFYGEPMTSSSNMLKLVPVLKEVLNQEFREMFSERDISIVFDGCSFEGDLVCVIFRYTTNISENKSSSLVNITNIQE